MAPSTRSKRTLTEADPNAEMSFRKAPKGSKTGRSSWVIMKKGETMEDVMGKTTEEASEKENEGSDHCAGCGKEIDEARNKIGEKENKDEGKGRAKVKAKSRARATSEMAKETGSSKPAKEIKESKTSSRGTIARHGTPDKENGMEVDKIRKDETKPGDVRKEVTTNPKNKSTKKGRGEPKTGNDKEINGEIGNKVDEKAAGPIEQEIKDALKNGGQGDKALKTNAGTEKSSSKGAKSRKDTVPKTSAKSTKADANPSAGEEKAESDDWEDAEDTESDPERVPFDAPGSTWITICRPMFDIKKENYENEVDEDEMDEDEDDERLTCGKKGKCMCRKPAELSPGWTWVYTKAGYMAFSDYWEEQMKRDQDNFQMHIYEDWNGYGITEVMENQLLDFSKEFKKKTLLPLWAKLEGISLFINTDLFQWGMYEDPYRKNAQLVALYGTLLLSTVDRLIAQNEFTPSSSIQNLGLVLGLFIEFAVGTGSTFCEDGQDGWTRRVVKMADKHGVEISGPFAIQETVKKIRDEMDEDDDEGDEEEEGREDDDGEGLEERSWRTWNWVKEFKAYKERHPGDVGGKKYDITKMSKAQMKRHQY
ncbi:hypothetical protein MMC17_003259 [Xylographa soralifera]|nr:hypothetical protein [Xylographa soralifera]